MENNPRILCVDDEEHVVQGLRLGLRKRFRVDIAIGGAQAIDMLRAAETDPYSVIISDMRMPKMSGNEVLTLARMISPDTVRVLLTGQADVASAIAAVNDGQIFRFLTKPCPPDQLIHILDSACAQYRLVTSERVLLSRTLKGAIDMLGDVLSMVSPTAFGRAKRISEYASMLAARLKAEDRWAIEIAAMLSQVATVTLPSRTLERYQRGDRLTTDELAMIGRLPAITEKLLSNIPRLESVREILIASASPEGMSAEAKPPFGARILKVAIDFDELESRGMLAELAIETMRGRKDAYDPVVFEAFAEINGGVERRAEVRALTANQLQPGMLLAEPLTSPSGSLICGRGQLLGETLIEHLKNLALGHGVREPIRVVVRTYSPRKECVHA